MSGPAIYSIDTSAFVHGWRRAYPPKRFGGLWAKIDELIEQGRLLASIEVFNELEKKDDEIFAWAKARKSGLFREIDDEVQGAVVHLMQAYPSWLTPAKENPEPTPSLSLRLLPLIPRTSS